MHVMMINAQQDTSGLLFGHWKTIAKVLPKNGKARWLCQCRCSNQKILDSYALRSGHTQSCGECWECEPTNNYQSNPDDSITVHCKNYRTFIIDKEDLSFVSQYQWHVNNRGYVVSGTVICYSCRRKSLLYRFKRNQPCPIKI